MSQHLAPSPRASDVQVRSTVRAGLAASVLLVPLAVVSLFQGRRLLSAGSLALVVLLAVSAWLRTRGHHLPRLTFAALVPAALFFLAVAFREQGVIGALWCLAAVPAFYAMLPERLAWAANGAILALGVVAAWIFLERPAAARVSAALVVVSVASAVFVRLIDLGRRAREARAARDPLTGVGNRLRLRAAIEWAVAQSRGTGAQMTLVALDLDHFAAINETLGREAGDAILRGVGELLRQRVRAADQAFRVGGDEFLVLLGGMDVLNGRDLAEQVRAAIAGLPLVSGRSVTASVGVAGLQPGEEGTAWVQRAGQRLRDARTRGGNRVVA